MVQLALMRVSRAARDGQALEAVMEALWWRRGDSNSGHCGYESARKALAPQGFFGSSLILPRSSPHLTALNCRIVFGPWHLHGTFVSCGPTVYRPNGWRTSRAHFTSGSVRLDNSPHIGSRPHATSSFQRWLLRVFQFLIKRILFPL